jgi:TetR/AcrR family transcriptional regulator
MATKLVRLSRPKGKFVPAKQAAVRRVRAKSTRRKTATRAVRKVGGEASQTRTDLLDAAEALMRREGYAAVTSRKVAMEANLTPQLVHYYFRTMDELFLALWRRFVSNNVVRHTAALQTTESLRAVWNFFCNTADTALESEFMALAHHRKAIRNEIAQDGDRFRQMQIETLSRLLQDYALHDDGCSAEIVTVLLTCISRNIVLETNLGMFTGHAHTLRFVEGWIDRLERRAAQTRREQLEARPAAIAHS